MVTCGFGAGPALKTMMQNPSRSESVFMHLLFRYELEAGSLGKRLHFVFKPAISLAAGGSLCDQWARSIFVLLSSGSASCNNTPFELKTNTPCILFQDEKFFTASDDSSVRAHLMSDGSQDGVLLRFTAPVTHMCFNSTGRKLFAGAR